MRSAIVAIIVGGLFVVPGLRGQTTGVPFMNDYTLTCVGCGSTSSLCFPPGSSVGTGGISGSTSANTLFFNVSAGGNFTITVTCPPGAQVFIFMNSCPCITCNAPLPPVCFLPFTACGATTTQSVDLDLSCTLSIPFSGFASGGGVYSVTFSVPPLPPGFCPQVATQAAILGNIACAGPVVVSQAYNVRLGG